MAKIDPIAKARSNPKSRKYAINGKCWDCQGGDADPGTVKRIRECVSQLCTLHPVRPYQRSDDEETDDETLDVTAGAS